MRQIAKQILEGGSRLPGLDALRRQQLRNRVLILAYHNIIPTGERPAGEHALHLPQEQFRRHLAEIARQCDVVPLDESVLEPGPARIRPRVVITFDDAYTGALTSGVEELARFGFPATFFACPGRLGGQTFWWDHLAAEHGGVLLPALRNRALSEFQGRDEPILRALSTGKGNSELPAWMRTADETLLHSALEIPGLALGAHTWSHPNLIAIPPVSVDKELSESLTWIRSFARGAVPWLAYPYGAASTLVEATAERVGFVAALRVSGGWYQPCTADRGTAFDLPRYGVTTGLTPQGLALRLMGFLCR